MRLHTLKLENFRQHADTQIDFHSGLTGIIGPNGSGKSTILEAIAWAIYGNAAARGTRDSIRFYRAKPRASVRVTLDFELGGHGYRVVRGLTTADLYLDGGSASIATTTTGVTELLRKRIGMSRDEFFSTYFTGQKELSVMAAMGPSERGQFLSRVLGYERLRGAQDLARRRRQEFVAEIGGLRQGMSDAVQITARVGFARKALTSAEQLAAAAERRKQEADRALSAIRPTWESSQQERERLQALLVDLRLAEAEHAAHRRELERLDRDFAETAAARETLQPLEEGLLSFNSLVSEFQRQDALAREEGRRSALIRERGALSEELRGLQERQRRMEQAPALEGETIEALKTKREQAVNTDRELEVRRTDWTRDQQEASTKRETLRKQYAELKEQREQLKRAGPDGICPTCMRPLGTNFQSVLELLGDQMETVLVDGRYYKDRLEQLTQRPEELVVLEERRRALYEDLTSVERRLTKIQVAIQEKAQLSAELQAKEKREALLTSELDTIPAGYDAHSHQSIRVELERLGPIDQKAARLRMQIEREPQIISERNRVAAALAHSAELVSVLSAERATAAFSEDVFLRLRDAHAKAAAELHAAELQAASVTSTMQGAQAALTAAENAARELLERQKLLDELNIQRRLHEELDRAFSDLRGDLNAEMGPELSDIASALLGELTDGRYTRLQLDEHYDVIVHEDEIAKPVISGGEEDLANLVLRLAVSQMIAERAGQPLSLLILDEIFGSLDEMRRASVLALLRQLKDRFEQVIVITHIESVREALDRMITVRYDDTTGSSVVEQSRSTGRGKPETRRTEEAGAAD
ncbi:MAG: SMC family ATPase [Gemmatimonadaceae bacterium]|nr:SMC family ATPase [Gemmatimonadaceae bacterium]